ncbi:MAG: hypothetical protein ACON4U_18315 [Myxococcota bacterium]
MNHFVCFFSLLVGCSDYDIKTVDETVNSGDEPESGVESSGDGDSNEPQDTGNPEVPNEEPPEDDCAEAEVAFDIEELSILQDAVSYSVAGWSQDAIVLNFDSSSLTPDQTWRVSAVEILVLISEAHFPNFTDGQDIHIQVFDSDHPNLAMPWTMSKSIVRSEHSWSSYTLPNDAWYAGTYGEFQQKGTWVRFDTRATVPSSGMTSSTFIVGVMWEPPGMVKVGYSNFNQDCELNWSNYGSGWVLNSENPVFFGCSWPMMRVEVEVVTPGDCD